MNSISRKSVMLILGPAAFIGGYAWNGQVGSMGEVSLIAATEARVGRPLTPVSYAGVARRTTRRVVATSAAVAPAPVVVAPPTTVVVAPTTQTCVDTVNPNGSVTRVCH